MYAGRMVETAPVEGAVSTPVHPYTEGLLAAIPKLDSDVTRLADHSRQHPDPDESIAGMPLRPALRAGAG